MISRAWHRRIAHWAALGGLIAAGSTAWAAGHNEPLTTAELLVAAAQDYALALSGRQTAADVQHVRALLRAAVRVDPKQGEAFTWLYELATLEGDEAAAAQALNGLLAAEPTHEGAFALWLAAGLRTQQTHEQRVEWLTQVAATRRPDPLRAMVHVRLARQFLERMDTAAAERELQKALALEPASIEARTLAYEVLEPTAPVADRLRAALRVVEVSPLAIEPVWHAAVLLDEYGFNEQAWRFFEYAQSVFQRINVNAALPPAFLLDMARNRLAVDDVEHATELARHASLASGPLGAEAGMLLYYLLVRQGLLRQGEDVRGLLARDFAAVTDPREHSAAMVAQAAWYYCWLDEQPQRALMLARAAAERAPRDPFVQRVLGWALALNLKVDEARAVLAPLAERDLHAAYRLARTELDNNDLAAARRILAAVDPRPTGGLAHDLAAMLELEMNAREARAARAPPTTAPLPTPTQAAVPAPPQPPRAGPTTAPATQPGAARPQTQPTGTQPARRAGDAAARERYPEIVAVLAGFDAAVLSFCDAPRRCLDARVTLADLGPAPGEPWWAEFTLTNIGTFPITLGPGGMINPVLLLSYKLEGDHTRVYPALTTLSMDAARVLDPGESTRLRRALDIGPVRLAMRTTPQHAHRITFQALLDAERTPSGRWQPGVGGQALPNTYFNRIPAATSPDGIAALFAALTDPDDKQRWRAIEVLAGLLGEQQQQRLSYRPTRVPVERIRAAFLRLLEDAAWEPRVRALDALQVAGLDRELATAVENCLDHPHWLVRLMATRVLARQGPAFAARAAGLAQHDTDELVRAVAGSYLATWTAAAGAQRAAAPATAPAAPPAPVPPAAPVRAPAPAPAAPAAPAPASAPATGPAH